jgi:hypothetical protein
MILGRQEMSFATFMVIKEDEISGMYSTHGGSKKCVQKLRRKILKRRLRLISEDNIKMGLKEIEYVDVN